MRSHYLDLLSLMLVVIGGVNWGFVAIFGFDPLAPILGGYTSVVTKIVYGAIGLAALRVFYAYLMTPGGETEKHR